VDLNLLDKSLAARGEPPYRARQVWEWAARGAGSYEEMTNVPAALRAELEHEVPLSSLVVERDDRSRDGTVKALLRTADDRPVEAVLMTYRDGRRSVCVSSQSGCPLTCAFCATGAMKFGRNLTASEILDQVLHFRRSAEVDHVVFMGMGEPMMNVDAVIAACERLPSVGVAASRTTVSTVGWVPGIERLAAGGPPVRLALSLHAADPALRSELKPVNDRFPLEEVLEACRAWREARRRRVFIEYVMLAGVNDRYEQALALAEALVPREAFKVNLIPYNPTGAGFEGSSRSAIDAFAEALRAQAVPVTVRLTRGRDIAAACGQLAGAAPGSGVPGAPELSQPARP
jgi:23S rRNA (adenine2503-C2)-methyltransferase